MGTQERAAFPVALRHPAPADLPHILAMWGRCSLVTRMTRFHAPVRAIPASYLQAVLADPSASLVAASASGSTIGGLASLVAGDGSSAELGVLVEDAWQRQGISRQLVTHLVAAAPAREITEVTASVLALNAAVADLLRQISRRVLAESRRHNLMCGCAWLRGCAGTVRQPDRADAALLVPDQYQNEHDNHGYEGQGADDDPDAEQAHQVQPGDLGVAALFGARFLLALGLARLRARPRWHRDVIRTAHVPDRSPLARAGLLQAVTRIIRVI
jgi:GNAT superfamily N-acetyltransferase